MIIELKYHNGRRIFFKVFLGGVPWDITESALFTAFKMYGPIRIEWPGKDNSTIPKGYLYVIFETDQQVAKPCSVKRTSGWVLSLYLGWLGFLCRPPQAAIV